ncbi:hypothetical protein QBC34DRAFT_385272 [Podospora aff. communis PSN243]|uniref:MEI5 protein n=1 Tax=Podospora aff. communis PSN243 TaxID=3040156 RepID=A0AAV9G7Q6_9PEZI|nr:hypothetical protein QBC34DRAFT_385272 [Podospora aff. communis PSN243]
MSTAARIDHAKVVGDLIEVLCKNPSFKHLEATYQENKRLKEEIEDLKATKRQNTKDLAEAFREIEAARKDAEVKAKMLDTEDKKKKELNTQHNATRQQLITTERKLVAMDNEIRRLQRFSIAMKVAPLQEITNILQSIFESARDFAEAYFGTDFPEDILKEPCHWKNIEERVKIILLPAPDTALVVKPIPLPASNAVPAMQMRVAATLTIVSDVFRKHIFNPVYLLPEDGGLTTFLSELAGDDSDQELHLRSVLLQSVADVQQDRTKQRVRLGVDELYGLLCPPFTGSDRTGLKSATEKLCGKACVDWQQIQQLRQYVEPHFTYHPNDIDDWLPFALKRAVLAGPSQKPQQNGQQNGSKTKGGKQPAPLGDDMSEIVVWPSFILNASDDALAKGYVLRETHLRAAREEEERLQKAAEDENRRRPSGARREQRFKTRRQSEGGPRGTASSDEALMQYVVPNTTTSSFLPGKGGGGQKSG